MNLYHFELIFLFFRYCGGSYGFFIISIFLNHTWRKKKLENQITRAIFQFLLIVISHSVTGTHTSKMILIEGACVFRLDDFYPFIASQKLNRLKSIFTWNLFSRTIKLSLFFISSAALAFSFIISAPSYFRIASLVWLLYLYIDIIINTRR